MVIPMGGGGGGGDDGFSNVMQMRTVPDQLIPRFRIIKGCLIVLIISLVVKLIAAGWLAPNDLFTWIWNSLNPILNTVIGIFLLKDDRIFGRVYQCCLTSICVSCQDSCPGGMSCLCTWFFCCMITAIFDLIPFNGTACNQPSGESGIMVIICGINKLNDRSQWEGGLQWLVMYSILVAATFFGLVSQIVGAVQGWKAFSEARGLAEGDGATGGGYGDPYAREDGGGGGGGGGWFSGGGGGRNTNQARDWGGGQALGSGGGGGGGPASMRGVEAPRGNPNNAFTPFGGAGQRLGS